MYVPPANRVDDPDAVRAMVEGVGAALAGDPGVEERGVQPAVLGLDVGDDSLVGGVVGDVQDGVRDQGAGTVADDGGPGGEALLHAPGR